MGIIKNRLLELAGMQADQEVAKETYIQDYVAEAKQEKVADKPIELAKSVEDLAKDKAEEPKVLDVDANEKVEKPKDVMAAIQAKIKEAQETANERFKEGNYDDGMFHFHVMDLMNKIKEYISQGTVSAMKDLTIYVTSIESKFMSQIPGEVWKFITSARKDSKEVERFKEVKVK